MVKLWKSEYTYKSGSFFIQLIRTDVVSIMNLRRYFYKSKEMKLKNFVKLILLVCLIKRALHKSMYVIILQRVK